MTPTAFSSEIILLVRSKLAAGKTAPNATKTPTSKPKPAGRRPRLKPVEPEPMRSAIAHYIRRMKSRSN